MDNLMRLTNMVIYYTAIYSKKFLVQLPPNGLVRSSKDLKNQSVPRNFELAICGRTVMSIFDVISNIFQTIDHMMRRLRKKGYGNGLCISHRGGIHGYIMTVTLVCSESVVCWCGQIDLCVCAVVSGCCGIVDMQTGGRGWYGYS